MLTRQKDAPFINVTCYQTLDEFEKLQPHWERLTAFNSPTPVFRLWEWNRLWWRNYQHLGELFVICVSIQGEIQGIAPFYKRKGVQLKLITVTDLHFIGIGGDTSPDDIDILFNPDYKQQIIETICHYILSNKAIQRYQLVDLPANSLFAKTLVSISQQLGFHEPKCIETKRRVMSLPDNYTDYLSSLSRNTRKRIKHRKNKLETTENISFKIARTTTEIDVAYKTLLELHHVRRSTKGASDSFSSNHYIEFHHDLIHHLASLNQVYLLALKESDKIIGVEYAYYVNDVLSFFQTGFDPDYEWLSPGHLMMTHLIQDAIERGASQIDLLKGEYEYKSSYAKEWKYSQTITIWRSSTLARVQMTLSRVRGYLQNIKSV